MRSRVDRVPLAGADVPAAAILERGGAVAIPTESSYGLAVDPRDAAGVDRVFRLKGRQAGKALPVVCAEAATLASLGVDPGAPALAWARSIWPAPLSVLVPLREPIPASAGLNRLAVRVPGHPGLRSLLARLGRPLTATSANPAGAEPYLDPEEVAEWLAGLGAVALVADGGRLSGGLPSTLVEWADGRPRVVRPGRYELD